MFGSNKSLYRIFIVAALTCVLFFFFGKSNPDFDKSKLIVGVHYYSWFPGNWAGGIFGDHLEPNLWPKLGKYESGEPQVVKQHLDWMKDSGINLIVFDWWIKRRTVKRNIKKAIELLDQQEQIKFAMHYESLDLKSNKDTITIPEGANVIYMTPERTENLKLHILDVAEDYMSNKNYLRIDGKPVLFLYATRHLVGPVAQAIKEVREFIKEKKGYDLYLVADEVYIQVLDYEKDKGIYVKDEYQPNTERVSAFDAITAYNPYDGRKTEQAGVKGVENYLTDVSKLYTKYQKIAQDRDISFIPTALPGYNDRGVRLVEDHFILSRDSQSEGQSFFSLNLNRLIRPFLDSKNPIFMVTSWNEWNEGSQIEPSVEFSEAAKDLSEGKQYASEELYTGYGFKHLNELREFIARITKEE
ncbi:MAG: glycoside hydrolase family 99-like domain-containing protein [Proteobacteria bacterium]|nr:glycoside hydrolase family 99-like domain-containing protein [Pseudomonadota bacterium]